MKRVAIIGGGLSGLSAAYQLARDARAEFTIFEASGRLGGIVETVRQDGFVIECGPDAWVTEKPWARDLAIELGLKDEIIPSNDASRRTYILREGRLVPMPDSMRMMVPMQLESITDSPLFSEQARLAYQREPERAGELKHVALGEHQDESVANFVRRHFGDEVTRTLAAPLLAGVFGGNIEDLSARAVMPAFVKMEREHGSLIRALQFKALQFGALQSRAGENENAVFTTLRSGLGTLVDRIVAMLPAGCIRLEDDVIALTQKSGRWRIRTRGAEEIFDSVIAATPAHIALRLLRGVDDEFAGLLEINSTSAIVVALAFASDPSLAAGIPPGFGFLVPPSNAPVASPEDAQLLACTFVHQKFPDRAPRGAALLRAFFGGETAAALIKESDATLAALALRRLSEALGPLPLPHITVVRRWPQSLPQYAVGHLDRMARLEKLVARFPGLHLIGNAYHGVGLPDMVRMGCKAAVRATHE